MFKIYAEWTKRIRHLIGLQEGEGSWIPITLFSLRNIINTHKLLKGNKPTTFKKFKK